ncbi:MAG: hypothetical protein ABIK37_05815 [candidate division WOR-3 bacterium]
MPALRPEVKPAASPSVVPRGRAARVLANLLRFIGLWAGISAAYAAMGGGACPCCGNPGCPVGIGVAGIVGALGSLIINYGRRWFATIRTRLGRRPNVTGH